MGRTCGGPDDIGLTPIGVELNGALERVHVARRVERPAAVLVAR